MTWWVVLLVACAACKRTPERTPVPAAEPVVVREETSAHGDMRLYSGSVADLDGDGALELVAGGCGNP
jgi:hypothetical protein